MNVSLSCVDIVVMGGALCWITIQATMLRPTLYCQLPLQLHCVKSSFTLDKLQHSIACCLGCLVRIPPDQNAPDRMPLGQNYPDPKCVLSQGGGAFFVSGCFDSSYVNLQFDVKVC